MPRLFSKRQPENASPVDVERIRELLQVAAEAEAAEVEIEVAGLRVVVRQRATSVAAPAVAPEVQATDSVASTPEPLTTTDATNAENELEGTAVRAPTPGTFYARPAPDAEPFVTAGDTVHTGDTLCIIEAMKLMNEVESEVTGTVLKILVSDGEPVEYDQPLFVIGTD